jgi:hypothetical protein
VWSLVAVNSIAIFLMALVFLGLVKRRTRKRLE